MVTVLTIATTSQTQLQPQPIHLTDITAQIFSINMLVEQTIMFITSLAMWAMLTQETTVVLAITGLFQPPLVE
jgi:hypothetical protein